MPAWFVAGGWVMWFLTLVGTIAIVAGLGFARRPDPEKLPRITCLSRALVWTIVAGVASDLAAVGIKIPNTPKWAHSPDLALLVLEGVGESMTPAVLGGALLSVIALLTAVGHGRQRAHGTAP
jgi:hypothetical protein